MKTTTANLDLAAKIIQRHCRDYAITVAQLGSRHPALAPHVRQLVPRLRAATCLPVTTIGAIFNLSLPETMALL